MKGNMRSHRLQKGRRRRRKVTKKTRDTSKDKFEAFEEARARRDTEHGVGDGGG